MKTRPITEGGITNRKFIQAPLPDNETLRLSTIESYDILRDSFGPKYQGITKLASIILGKPTATISIIDAKHQWFKASVGLEADSTPRELSFCQYTILENKLMEIEDTLKSPVFKSHPMVLGAPNIRYYVGAPLFTTNGVALGTLCLIDKKPGKLEEWQKQALENLAHAVTEMIELKTSQKEMKKAVDLAYQSASANANFLSTMSHEIRTPLNSIIGMTHILMNENPSKEQVPYLETLKFSANNLMVIVNDVLDFNKIEAGKISIESIPMSIGDIAHSIRKANLLRAEENGNIIKIRKDEDVPDKVLGDPVRLSQILNNLVSNAIKFTKKGRILIDIMATEYKNDIVTIEFRVIDNGIGIAKENHDKIFRSFVQANTETARKYGGTGLGLSITKRLVELQNGDISFQSREGKGSTFKFTISYPVYRSIEVPNKRNEEFENLEGGRILIAEDNRVNAMIARKIIEKWGIKVDLAENGREAVTKVLENQDNQYDLVLMDLQMPDIDGYEANNLIRDAGFVDLPIIAFSASVILSEQKKALDIGMNDYITKPFNPMELYEKLRKYLLSKPKAA